MYKYYLFPYFLFVFWFSNMILSDSLILPVSQLQPQQVMIALHRSHVDLYRLILFLWLFCSRKMMKNLALMAGFNTI